MIMSPFSRSGSQRRVLMILAVAAGIAWLWHQEGERRQLVEQIDGLRSRLVDRERLERQRPDPRPEPRSGLEREPVDWEAIASQLKANGWIAGGLLNNDARLLAAIEAMSESELLAMLDQIAAADLSKSEREVLERAFAEALVKKAPGIAFSRFSVSERHDWNFFLDRLYLKWVQEDATAALSWLRLHTSRGGYVHRRMISVPFFDQLPTDPRISAELLSCLPPESRLGSLSSLEVRVLRDKGQADWAQIVREILPEKDRSEAIAWPLGNWSDGDGSPMSLDQVDAYLECIRASDQERNACVMTVAETTRSWGILSDREVGPGEALERMRSWVAERAPQLLEPATLKALDALGREAFGIASEWSLKFHGGGGNDAYLTAVLEHMTGESDAATVRTMIERLSDPVLRAKYGEMARILQK